MTTRPLRGVTATLGAAVLSGAVTGGRSATGLAALSLSASEGRLHSRVFRSALVMGAVGEYVADALPMTPSRLFLPSLVGRTAIGVTTGALVAQRLGDSDEGRSQHRVRLVISGIAGGAAAVCSSFVGAKWRGLAADRFGFDLPGALIEDIVVLAGATALSKV